MTDGTIAMLDGAFHLPRKRARVFLLGLMLAAASSGAAVAQSCQEDFQKLSQRRMGQIEALNRLGKAGKGKMDPIAACPAARRLVSVESEMLGYMEKNKEWCAIPDNVVDGFKQARAKSQGFAAQACAVAAKVKKMQEMQKAQAAAGGGPGQAPAQKLPSGPL
jgi:hypothetical protein